MVLRRCGNLGVVLWIVLKILLTLPVIIAVAFYVVWERKLIGWMHVRHGPMYAGMGILRRPSLTCSNCCSRKSSDACKAQKFHVHLAPLLALAPAFAAWAVVPID